MIKDLTDILFLDIETVPAFKSLFEVPQDLRQIWIESNSRKRKKKAADDALSNDGEGFDDKGPVNEYGYHAAGLSAEFGRVICVSLGYFEAGSQDADFKIHSIFSHNERDLLLNLSSYLAAHIGKRLCAHNGKNFDFPFLAKRFIVQGIPLPAQFDIMGKKPWEIPHLDTQELWSFGARGKDGSVKLKLLCAVLGIPSPKDDIDGSMVRDVYYEENQLERIVAYCEKDVVTLAKVLRKMVGQPSVY